MVVSEEEIHCDLQLHDRFCGFSAELARLALLSLAGVGWLVNTAREPLLKGWAAWPLAVGIGFSCVSVLTSLLHRFWATDALACQVRARRLSKALKDGMREPQELESEEAAMRRRLRSSARALKIAWFTMGAGSVCIGAGLILALAL